MHTCVHACVCFHFLYIYIYMYFFLLTALVLNYAHCCSKG